MHYSTLLLISAVAVGESASLKVNYFSDGGCQDYMISIYPPADDSCYDYNWTSQNSVAVAESTFRYGTPVCTYYTRAKCAGSSKTEVGAWPQQNCASNLGHGFVSMRCRIIHELKA